MTLKQFLKYSLLVLVFIFISAICTYLTISFFIKSEDSVVVPDLIDKDIVYVLEILTDLGLNTKFKGSEFSDVYTKNHVISQNPEPGSVIKKGRDVRIVFSKGNMEVIMPNLYLTSIQQARLILEENDLCVGSVSKMYSAGSKKDLTIAQFPPEGTVVSRNSCVNLLISLGQPLRSYNMPELTGLSLNEAIFHIEKNGLELGEIKSEFIDSKSLNTITRQSPTRGHRISEGDTINLTINRPPGSKKYTSISAPVGVNYFRYRADKGFLKQKVRIRRNSNGIVVDLFDDFLKPGHDAWVLIPQGENSTLFLYVDDELIETKVYD